jgi:DNA polymerase
VIFLDLETFSEVPINVGTYRYAANCEVMLLAYAIDDGPARVLDLTASAHAAHIFTELTLGTHLLTAHNAMFDRNALRLGNLKIDIPIKRWRCTMAQALAHSLPGGLEKLGEIFKIDDDKQKAKRGKELVQLFCKPRPKNMKLRRATRHTHPKEWAEFVEYARLDVEAMRAVHKKMPEWNYTGFELDLWHLDQKINDRGMCIDVEFAKGAIGAVAREQKRLNTAVQDHTEGAVQSATQRDALLGHILAEYGVDLPDMTAATIERRANDPDLPIELRELLMLRLDSATTSTAKYRRFVGSVNGDGRVRGTAQFCGAARTGRWAHRTVQPGNMPRPSRDFDEVCRFIEAVKAGCADLV